jgi:putative membrane protein
MTRYTRTIFAALLAVMIATLVGCAREYGEEYGQQAENPRATEPAASSMESQRFVEEANAAAQVEVSRGEIAEAKAQSQEVKDFGRMMVDDHSRTGEELEEVAESLGISVPDQLPAAEQQAMEDLSELSGEDFDREYLSEIVDAHRQAVELFRRASTQIDLAPELQRFASDKLPKLEEHLRRAQELSGVTTI